MSEPTPGPYEVRLGSNPMAESFGLPCIVPAGRVVALAVLPDRVIEQYDGFGDLMADAHLLASSWAMREALTQILDAMALEELDQSSTRMLRRFDHLRDKARAALAASRGEAR